MKRLCATVLLVLWCLGALAVQKSATIVYINGAKYYVHTVQPGETLYALSKAYEVGEQVIVANNPSAAAGLRAGENVKIPYVAEASERLTDKKLRKTFDTHTVTRGETLYAISRRYGIPIPTIVADNPALDPIRLRLGERILIRKKQRGAEDEAGSLEQWEAYRQSLNSVAENGYAYHMVHPGETFYSLSHRFGISEQELSALNGGLQAADLKAGAIVKVPAQQSQMAEETPGADSLRFGENGETPRGQAAEIEFRPLGDGETLDVALMLPIEAGRGTNANYLEFYQGFLLGLEAVKNSAGRPVNVTLFNTGRDPERVEELTASEEFRRSELIVGPVYEEGLHPVVRFAEEHAVPVVTPLANVTKMNSDVLFQMAPDPARKYEKVADLINGDRQVTLIYTESTDKEFEKEILTLLGDAPRATHTYKYEHPSVIARQREGYVSPSDLTPLLDNDRDNLFIVMADNEVDVDRILAALASADTGLASRGRTVPRFTVLGNSRWNRYNNIDRTMFFKDRVVFISTYHAKRDSQAVTDFDSAYIRAFGALPTLYSYRGYDAAAIFVPAMFNDIQYDMEGRTYTPLQTSYVFGQSGESSNHVNRNWTRVNYNTDFTITIE